MRLTACYTDRAYIRCLCNVASRVNSRYQCHPCSASIARWVVCSSVGLWECLCVCEHDNSWTIGDIRHVIVTFLPEQHAQMSSETDCSARHGWLCNICGVLVDICCCRQQSNLHPHHPSCEYLGEYTIRGKPKISPVDRIPKDLLCIREEEDRWCQLELVMSLFQISEVTICCKLLTSVIRMSNISH